MVINFTKKLSACLAGVILAWALLYGLSTFDWKIFFVPWGHDDFFALSGFEKINLRLPRPMSTNIILFFGQFGPVFYYIFVCGLVFLDLALTSYFVDVFFELSLQPLVLFFFSFATAVSFFSTPYATYSFQYLGLATNLLSYNFSILAAIVLLNRRTENFLFIAFFLVLLSAFSKEDMAIFLFDVALLCVWRRWKQLASKKQKLLCLSRYIAIVIIPYLLIAAHSFVFGSPYLSNRGVYNLRDAADNIFNNLSRYFVASRGSEIIYMILMFLSSSIVVAAFVTKKATRDRNVTIVSFVFIISLLFPYLLLPRFFAYYAVTFFPMAAATVLALGLIFINLKITKRKPSSTAIYIVTFFVVSATPYIVDFDCRSNVLSYFNKIRNNINNNFTELGRVSTLGLNECSATLVTGMSNGLTPFLTNDISYLNNRFKLHSRWIVSVTPNSDMSRYGIPSPSNSTGSYIRAIPSNILNSKNENMNYDCILDFDQTTGKANFRRYKRFRNPALD